MTNKKNLPQVRALTSLVLISSMLVSCGGGGGKTPSNSTKAQAIDKIKTYANNGSSPTPTLQDYIDAGVTGVTSDNLSELNDVVEGLVAADVDTTEELDALTASLGVNIKPTAEAGADKTVQVNNTVTLTGEGTDSDGSIASFKWSKGETTLATNAEFDYTPTSVGTDTLTLTVTDNDGATDTDTVTITVTAAPVANQAPVANNGTATTNEDTAKAVTLAASDNEGDTLSYLKVTDPAHGTVSISGNTATYTPTANYNGPDSFTFKANDGSLDSNIATVNITVTAVNDAPVASDKNAATQENTGKAITLTAVDVDGDSLSYSKVTDPAHGTVSFAGNIATYTPAASYNGADSFTYKANDGSVDSNIATVNISVSDVNNAPTANAGSDVSVVEGQSVNLNGSGTDPDSGDTLSYSWSPSANLSNTSIAQPSYMVPAVSGDTPNIITLTVTDSGGLTDTDTVTVTVLNLPAQPQNTTAVAADAQATITWDSVADATAYDICYSTVSIANAQACSAAGETLLSNKTSPTVVSSLSNGTQYYFVVVPKNANGKGVTSSQVTATPTGTPATPSPTGRLNDTGILSCGDYAYDAGGTLISGHTHSNDENCAAMNDAEGDPIPSGQDGLSITPFDFTKLDAAGVPLADQTQNYATTPWSCVKDNTTGLIWEVKTDDGGIHDKNNQYTWYNPDNTTNGGNAGTENGGVNTHSFVTDTNTAGLCGASTWRLPTIKELLSITSYEEFTGSGFTSINTDYFPNTVNSRYFSSTGNASNPTFKLAVFFNFGYAGQVSASTISWVRLVRSQ